MRESDSALKISKLKLLYTQTYRRDEINEMERCISFVFKVPSLFISTSDVLECIFFLSRFGLFHVKRALHRQQQQQHREATFQHQFYTDQFYGLLCYISVYIRVPQALSLFFFTHRARKLYRLLVSPYFSDSIYIYKFTPILWIILANGYLRMHTLCAAFAEFFSLYAFFARHFSALHFCKR